MFKYILILVLSISISATVFSQDGDAHKSERVESFKIAYITNKLELTPQESEKFWPVYNQYQREKKDLRSNFKNRSDINKMSETEAEKLIENNFIKEEKVLELKKNLIIELKNVVSAKKIVMLHLAEREFHRELIGRVKNQKRNRN